MDDWQLVQVVGWKSAVHWDLGGVFFHEITNPKNPNNPNPHFEKHAVLLLSTVFADSAGFQEFRSWGFKVGEPEKDLAALVHRVGQPRILLD